VALFTSGSGWLLAALLAAAIAAAGLTHVLRLPHGPAAAGWLRSHNGLGAAAAPLGVVYGLGSVTRTQLPLGAEVGLWMAGTAMVLLVWVAVLGLLLSAPGTPHRDRLRRRHLALMVALVVTVTAHVLLNGPVPQ
jgi:hypothetical protein